jgi:Na+/melibiose symporter-like transporter
MSRVDALLSTAPRKLSTAVEDYAVKSDCHNAGIYFAANSFAVQCAAGLGILAAGIVLETSRFPTRAMTDSPIAHEVPMVMALWGIGCLVLWFYLITQAQHLENVETLRAREAEANARVQSNNPVSGATR